MTKKVLLVCHPDRSDVTEAAALLRQEAAAVDLMVDDNPLSGEAPDLVLALGGDGTILAAGRYARQFDVPLLGINFGRMGFLADTSRYSLAEAIRRIRTDRYFVDTRMTLDVDIVRPDGTVVSDWALNEAVVLHADMAHPAGMVFAVDGQDVSTYGADGIILATPTGSTAYSFSAGGPVVWPDTEAIVMAPLAAHGLFTRPLVVSPKSLLEVGILEDNRSAPEVWMDGLHSITAPAGSVVRVRRGKRPVTLAHLDNRPFSERLVSKFSLPVSGWRAGHHGMRNDS